MIKYTREEIRAGNVPYMLWYYVGETQIIDFKVTNACLLRVNFSMNDDKQSIAKKYTSSVLAASHMKSVILACQAINRMMGKYENDGMYDGRNLK